MTKRCTKIKHYRNVNAKKRTYTFLRTHSNPEKDK